MRNASDQSDFPSFAAGTLQVQGTGSVSGTPFADIHLVTPTGRIGPIRAFGDLHGRAMQLNNQAVFLETAIRGSGARAVSRILGQ